MANAYLDLIRGNRDFRRLWIGEIASFLGDWLNTIALYTLVRQLTGSPLALGVVLITKMLPFALASPIAGLLTDRYNRRRLMIASDLARAAVVTAFLLVDEPGELPLLYALIAAQMVIGAVFVPARSASIPNITSGRDLLTANALSSATWSTLLAVGAALGGFATEALGVRAVFLLDVLSYLISAGFIYATRIPQSTARPSHGRRGLAALFAVAHHEIVDGWRQMLRRGEIGRIALAKTAWSVGGGGLVYLLTLMGERLTPAAPAVGIGLLYAFRGVGTGVGPIVVRAVFPQESRWPAIMGVGLAVGGLFYVGVGAMPWTDWLLPGVLLAHAPSGANWVMSTVLLQHRTEDRYRGRIFATEWLLLTGADTLSILVASVLLESKFLDLRLAVMVFAAVQVVTGLAWLLLVVPAERRLAGASSGREHGRAPLSR